MFMSRYVGHSRAIKIVDGCAEADRICDIAGAGFEALRRRLIKSLFEGDVLDHVATALPRRHMFEDIRFSIHDSNAGRREDLMTGEDEEVAVEGLDVHAHV